MSRARLMDFLIGVPLLYLLAPFQKKVGDTSAVPVKKILIIKLAAVGDTVLLFSVLKKFREKHPEDEIHWLVSPVNASVAVLSKSVNEFIVWDKQIGISLLKLIRKLKKEKYDAVVDLEQWSRGTALISFLTGAPLRLGFDTPGQYRAILFNKKVTKKYEDHEINDFVRVLSLLGPFDFIDRLELPLNEAGKEELLETIQIMKTDFSKRPWIVIHPGCGHDGLPREWPLVSYALIAHWLKKELKGVVFITGGPEERVKTGKLNQLLNNEAVNLGGRLSWNGLMALINESDLVISGNTGVVHIAAALQKKQVVLHGPTNSKLWGPINPQARVVSTDCPQCPCLKLGFEYHAQDQSCMKRIKPEDVKAAVASLFDISG